MFSVAVTKRGDLWIVESSEDGKVTFTGWYRTLVEAEARRETEIERLRRKYPDEPINLRS